MKKLLAVIQIVVISVVGFLGYQVYNLKSNLGATIPTVVALYEDSLNDKVTSTATSMTLVRGTDKAGTALSGTYGFIIDEGTSSEEFVTCTASSTALTSCTRGISVVDGKTAVTALQYSHRRGASIKITNFPQLAILSRILNGTETLPNRIAYTSHPSFTGSAASTSLATKFYVDSVATAGSPDANTTTKGIVEIATSAELIAGTGTGGTGAILVIPGDYFTASSSPNEVPVLNSTGFLDSTFINYDTATLTVTGDNKFGVVNVSSNSFSDATDKIIRSDGDSVPSGLWIDITKLNITASASGDLVYHNGTTYSRLAMPTITNGATFDLVASVSGGTPKWNDTKNDFASGHGTVVDTDATLVRASVSFTPNYVELHYSCDGANNSPSGGSVYLRKDGSTVGIKAVGEGADTTGSACYASSGNGITFVTTISTDGDTVYITATEEGTAATTAFFWFAGR